MKVDLQKELDVAQTKRSHELGSFESLLEVKALLSGQSQEEERILRSFGLNDAQREVEANRGIQITLEKVREEQGSAYEKKQLKKLAIAYDLKLLPLENFIGGIDTLLAGKMVEFCKRNNIEIDRARATNCFVVLAPYEDFDLTYVGAKRPPRPVVARDPLLFYRESVESTVYSLVHKWGNDFTPMRALRAFPFISERNFLLYKFTVAFMWSMLFVPLVLTFLFPMINANFFWTFLPSLVVAVISTICTWADREKRNGFRDFFTKDIWTKPVQRPTLEK